MKTLITLAATAALLAGGASPAAAAAKPAAKYDRQQCFYTRNVESFAAPDDKTLYVRVTGHQVYRFDMFGHCPDIDWTHRLALVSRGSSWICSGMDAEVVTHATGLGLQRCPVAHMQKLTPAEVAALPKRARP